MDDTFAGVFIGLAIFGTVFVAWLVNVAPTQSEPGFRQEQPVLRPPSFFEDNQSYEEVWKPRTGFFGGD